MRFLLGILIFLTCSAALAQDGLNLAPSGKAYRWAHNSAVNSNANRASASGLNDGSTDGEVNLSGGSGASRTSYQAAGIVWSQQRSFAEVVFFNGRWESTGDGTFCADLRIQTSANGVTWVDASWSVVPVYRYGPSAAGIAYRFSGPAVSARGVRIVGRVRCTTEASYWVNARELQVFSGQTGGGNPSTPNNLSATANSIGRVDLGWEASTDDDGISGYRLLRNGTEIAFVDSTQYADNNVEHNSTYNYQVIAVDRKGNVSGLSNVATVTTLPGNVSDVTPPSVPGNLVATSDASGSIVLTWDASTDNVGVYRYQVVRSDRSAPLTETVGTRFIDAAVVPGTTYEYRVRALDAAGNVSALSTPATATASDGANRRGWMLTTVNIGLAPHGLDCNTLPLYQGSGKPAAGTIIREVRVTTPLDLSNGNILIERACIRPASVGSHHAYLVTTTICEGGECRAPAVGDVVIRDSEIDGSALPAKDIAGSCAFLGVGTLERNLMHGMGSGICFFETGPKHSARATQNYVRGLRSWGDPSKPDGSHNEAATVRDFRDAPGRKVEFINNRLDCSGGNETGALFLQPTWLPIHNVTIQGNLLEGGGWNLYLESTKNASYGKVSATNNRFLPTGWGAVANPSGPGFTSWQDNFLYDPLAEDGRGERVAP